MASAALWLKGTLWLFEPSKRNDVAAQQVVLLPTP